MLIKNTAFTEYKGAFTEQFVLQEIEALDREVYYHSREKSQLEIDFAIQKYNGYLIEVKAEENLKSKSLKTIFDSNNDLKPVRFSMAGYREQAWMVNVTLYLAAEWIDAVRLYIT